MEKKEKPHKMGEITPATVRDSYYFFRFRKQVKLNSQSEGILSEMGSTVDSTCSVSQKAANSPGLTSAGYTARLKLLEPQTLRAFLVWVVECETGVHNHCRLKVTFTF